MSYYPTIEEDVARARAILAESGTIYGKDTHAAYKLLESFVEEILLCHQQMRDATVAMERAEAELTRLRRQ